MGWKNWCVHSERVSEEAIRGMASAMAEKALDQFGWIYINIDDCWMEERHMETKVIQANERFDDMSVMMDYVISKGFKMGKYSTTWMSTFARKGLYPASYLERHECIRFGFFQSIQAFFSEIFREFIISGGFINIFIQKLRC